MMELNKFYNIDCMEYMQTVPDKYFELAIVDPPYGIGDINRYSKSKKKSIHKKINWNNEIPNKNYFIELYRISINQIIWGCNYYNKFINVVGRIVHYKDLTKWSKGKNLSECDLASQSFNKKIEFYNYQWSGNVQNGKINWNNIGMDGRIHPTQKPVALYRWLLQNYAKPGDKIFDSHVGSGSSLIACIEEGFEYVGCELDKDYYETASKRIQEHISQGRLFTA